MTKPFEGVRILDFTQVFAGPFGTYQLALLGADVIKVERKGGEHMRFSPGSKEWADRAMAPTWCAVNANKRNIELDLKDPKAIEIVKRLAKKADIVAENFRPGVMDRLGIGYEALSEINPKLIYCAVSGFGQEGPWKNTPSYDGRIQATSGIMSITGHEDSVPTRARLRGVRCLEWYDVGLRYGGSATAAKLNWQRTAHRRRDAGRNFDVLVAHRL